MNKVYLVQEYFDLSPMLKAIFSTEEKADNFIEKQEDKDLYFVEEIIIDNED